MWIYSYACLVTTFAVYIILNSIYRLTHIP